MINHKYLNNEDIVFSNENLTIIFICETTKCRESKLRHYLKHGYKEQPVYLILNSDSLENHMWRVLDMDIREINDFSFSFVAGWGTLFFRNHKTNPNVLMCIKSTKRYLINILKDLKYSDKEEKVSEHYHYYKMMFSDEHLLEHLGKDLYRFFKNFKDIGPTHDKIKIDI